MTFSRMSHQCICRKLLMTSHARQRPQVMIGRQHTLVPDESKMFLRLCLAVECTPGRSLGSTDWTCNVLCDAPHKFVRERLQFAGHVHADTSSCSSLGGSCCVHI